MREKESTSTPAPSKSTPSHCVCHSLYHLISGHQARTLDLPSSSMEAFYFIKNRCQLVTGSGWQCNHQILPGEVTVMTQGHSPVESWVPVEGCWCKPMVTPIKRIPGEGGTTLSPTVAINQAKRALSVFPSLFFCG